MKYQSTKVEMKQFMETHVFIVQVSGYSTVQYFAQEKKKNVLQMDKTIFIKNNLVVAFLLEHRDFLEAQPQK